MADIQLLLEAERRGLLPPDKKALLDEARRRGLLTGAAVEEESGILRQVADVPVQVASGIATGVRLISDAFGAANPVSQSIRGVEDYLQGLLSAQAKNDQQEIARIMKEAEDKGIGSQLVAAVKAFATAPIDLIAQAAGTAVPTIAGGLAAGVLRAPALLASTGVGATMGAGVVKSSIYDATYETLREAGASEEDAKSRAELAQEYGGENLDQILLGTVLGGVAGRIGVEPAVAKQLAGEITKRSIAKTAATEAGTEAAQAGQEQLAQNIALQRQGFDVPTMRGVAGAAGLEALAGAGVGAAGEVALGRMQPVPEVEPSPPEAPPETPPEAPPETRTEAAPPTAEPVDELLAEFEDVEAAAPAEDEVPFEAPKPQETDLNIATNIARTRVQETGKTAAPYIQNAVNAYRPAEMPKITLEQAKQIRQQLVNEGIITGKDKVKKVELTTPAPTTPAPTTPAPTTPAPTTPATTELPKVLKVTHAPSSSDFPNEAAIIEKYGTADVIFTPETLTEFENLDVSMTGAEINVTPKTPVLAGQVNFNNFNYNDLNKGVILSGSTDKYPTVGLRVSDLIKTPIPEHRLELNVGVNTVFLDKLYDPKGNKISSETAKNEPQFRRAFGDNVIDAFIKGSQDSTQLDVVKAVFGTGFQNEINQTRQLFDEKYYAPARAKFPLPTDIVTAKPTVTTPPAKKAQAKEEEEGIVSYDDLERQQIDAATKDLEEEAEDVSARADETIVGEAKPKRRRKGAKVPVSGGPLTPSGAAAVAEQKVGEAVAAGVDATSDTADTITAGEGRESTPLKQESAATPLETYQSLLRRVEGLRTSKRIDVFNFNRIRTQLKRANPVTNPEGYAEVQREADELLNQYEMAAEAREAEDTAQGIDRRERQLKDQERIALNRAQRQIAQDKVAESLRTRFDRGLTEEEVLPQQARKIREALEGNDIKSATQMLVQPAAANETYPKSAEKFRPLFTAVARKLNDTDFSNVKVQTEATPGANLEVFKRLKDEFKNAEFDPATNTLYVRRDRAYSYTIMHELVHAGTVETIRGYEVDKLEKRLKEAEAALAAAKGEKEIEKAKARVQQVKNQQLGVRRLMATYELVQTQADDLSLVREFPNAFENMYEFIAVGLTSPQFQSRLAQIEVALPARRVNLWTEFVEAISKLFGLDVKSGGTTTALNEVGQAFSEILAAPTSEGVTGIAPLAEKERKKAEKEPKPEIDPFAEVSKQIDSIRGNRLTLRGLIQYLTSSESVENLIKNFQDEQRYLRRMQIDMDRAQVANWASAKDGGNTLAAAVDASAGLYQNFEPVVTPLIQNNNKAVNAYAARKGISYDDALKLLDTYFMAEAIEVRRLTNYLKQKPLSTKPTLRLKGAKDKISPAQLRDKLIDSVLTTEVLSDARRDAIHARLMQLAGVEIGPDGKVRRTADAAKYEDKLGASYHEVDREGKARKPGPRDLNYDSAAYDIIAGWSVKVNKNVLDKLKAEMSKFGNEINAVRNSLVELDKITMKFNEEANYLTQPAKNLIKLYGWGDKYVPLMGKVSKEYKNTEGAIYANTVPNEILPGFRTRETLPDSPILMSQINAGKATARAARSDIVPTLVNLMKPNLKNGKTYVTGKSMGVITFKERYQNAVDYTESDGEGGRRWTGRDKFYNFLPNGDIEVWKVYDEPVIDSLRPEWEPPKGLMGRALSAGRILTSFVGQQHTRFQLKFAPYDFPRNVFANAGAIYSEMGRENAGKYFAGIGREVFQKARIPQVWKIANAHFNGDFNTIKKIGGFNEKTQRWKDPFVEAAYQFLERGGKVSIVRSWQTRGQLEELIDRANKSNIRQSVDDYWRAFTRIFDLWLDGFELVARVEGFRVAKSYATNERRMSEADAERYAVNFSKNLANFEKRGLKKLPGALYAFWNPAATGAVRAFEAIMPTLRIGYNGKNLEKILDELPSSIKDDPQARANYAERYQQLARNGQGAIAAYAGVGFMFYMMALSLGAVAKGVMGDDEEDPKNVVAEDSKELWTRNLRIPLGWLGIDSLEQKFFQIPWGFGMGAFAAAGAQVAAQVSAVVSPNRDASLKEFLGNTASIAADSFFPLPVARFNPLDSPINWMFASFSPSVVRPFYEYVVNMNGLGQSIHRNYYNRYGPAYAGSQNIEEFFRGGAKIIGESSGGRWQPEPNEVRFWMTSYFDGVASIMSDAVNLGLTFAVNEKDFDPKTDLVILDNYIGNKISPDLILFSKASPRIETLKRGFDSAINSPNSNFRDRFLRDNPNAPAIVYIYNQQLSQMRRFRDLTTEAEVFAKTPKERKALQEDFNKSRDILMGQVVNLYKQYQDDIDGYYKFYSPLTSRAKP